MDKDTYKRLQTAAAQFNMMKRPVDKSDIYFRCAYAILNDECPPDRHFYLCKMGEEPELDCVICWDNYLWYLNNGLDSYESDRKRIE